MDSLSKGVEIRVEDHSNGLQRVKRDMSSGQFSAQTKISKICLNCNKICLVRPTKVKHGFKFCSIDCKHNYNRESIRKKSTYLDTQKIHLVCSNPACSKDFVLLPYEYTERMKKVNDKENFYCSTKCSQENQFNVKIETIEEHLEIKIKRDEELKRKIWLI